MVAEVILERVLSKGQITLSEHVTTVSYALNAFLAHLANQPD